MAATAPKICLLLQMLGALVLIITGIGDRVEANNRPSYLFFPLSYIVMPVWTGVLVSFRMLCKTLCLPVPVRIRYGYSVEEIRVKEIFTVRRVSNPYV